MVKLKNKKILLASHDSSCAEVIVLLLKSWGYEALWTTEGSKTLESISRFVPDLVIIDYNLPGGAGLAIIKELKSDYHHAHIPMLLMIEKRNVRRDILEIDQGLDDYLVKPPDPIDLEVRIEMALRRTEHHFFANSLTKLPGSRMLEGAVQQRLNEKQVFSFFYCDINNFKSFNDKYGYKRGDAVIIQTAYILMDVIKHHGQRGDFVFHIGGDDFVILASSASENAIARNIIEQFDKIIPFHYCEVDRRRGFIRMKDRQGKQIDFPLMSISIAIVNNVHRQMNSLIEFIEIAFELKGYLKQQAHSKSMSNRRKIHQPVSLKEDSEHTVPIQKTHPTLSRSRYRPLGQILLERSMVNQFQLDAALIKHWNSNMRLGEVLIDMNIIEKKKIEEILHELKAPPGLAQLGHVRY